MLQVSRSLMIKYNFKNQLSQQQKMQESFNNQQTQNYTHAPLHHQSSATQLQHDQASTILYETKHVALQQFASQPQSPTGQPSVNIILEQGTSMNNQANKNHRNQLAAKLSSQHAHALNQLKQIEFSKSKDKATHSGVTPSQANLPISRAEGAILGGQYLNYTQNQSSASSAPTTTTTLSGEGTLAQTSNERQHAEIHKGQSARAQTLAGSSNPHQLLTREKPERGNQQHNYLGSLKSGDKSAITPHSDIYLPNIKPLKPPGFSLQLKSQNRERIVKAAIQQSLQAQTKEFYQHTHSINAFIQSQSVAQGQSNAGQGQIMKSSGVNDYEQVFAHVQNSRQQAGTFIAREESYNSLTNQSANSNTLVSSVGALLQGKKAQSNKCSQKDLFSNPSSNTTSQAGSLPRKLGERSSDLFKQSFQLQLQKFLIDPSQNQMPVLVNIDPQLGATLSSPQNQMTGGNYLQYRNSQKYQHPNSFNFRKVLLSSNFPTIQQQQTLQPSSAIAQTLLQAQIQNHKLGSSHQQSMQSLSTPQNQNLMQQQLLSHQSNQKKQFTKNSQKMIKSLKPTPQIQTNQNILNPSSSAQYAISPKSFIQLQDQKEEIVLMNERLGERMVVVDSTHNYLNIENQGESLNPPHSSQELNLDSQNHQRYYSHTLRENRKSFIESSNSKVQQREDINQSGRYVEISPPEIQIEDTEDSLREGQINLNMGSPKNEQEQMRQQKNEIQQQSNQKAKANLKQKGKDRVIVLDVSESVISQTPSQSLATYNLMKSKKQKSLMVSQLNAKQVREGKIVQGNQINMLEYDDIMKQQYFLSSPQTYAILYNDDNYDDKQSSVGHNAVGDDLMILKQQQQYAYQLQQLLRAGIIPPNTASFATTTSTSGGTTSPVNNSSLPLRHKTIRVAQSLKRKDEQNYNAAQVAQQRMEMIRNQSILLCQSLKIENNQNSNSTATGVGNQQNYKNKKQMIKGVGIIKTQFSNQKSFKVARNSEVKPKERASILDYTPTLGRKNQASGHHTRASSNQFTHIDPVTDKVHSGLSQRLFFKRKFERSCLPLLIIRYEGIIGIFHKDDIGSDLHQFLVRQNFSKFFKMLSEYFQVVVITLSHPKQKFQVIKQHLKTVIKVKNPPIDGIYKQKKNVQTYEQILLDFEVAKDRDNVYILEPTQTTDMKKHVKLTSHILDKQMQSETDIIRILLPHILWYSEFKTYNLCLKTIAQYILSLFDIKACTKPISSQNQSPYLRDQTHGSQLNHAQANEVSYLKETTDLRAMRIKVEENLRRPQAFQLIQKTPSKQLKEGQPQIMIANEKDATQSALQQIESLETEEPNTVELTQRENSMSSSSNSDTQANPNLDQSQQASQPLTQGLVANPISQILSYNQDLATYSKLFMQNQYILNQINNYKSAWESKRDSLKIQKTGLSHTKEGSESYRQSQGLLSDYDEFKSMREQMIRDEKQILYINFFENPEYASVPLKDKLEVFSTVQLGKEECDIFKEICKRKLKLF